MATDIVETNNLNQKNYPEESDVKLGESYIRKDRHVIDSIISAPAAMTKKIKDFDNKHPEVVSSIFLAGVGALSAILFYSLIANAVCAGEIRAFRKLYKIAK